MKNKGELCLPLCRWNCFKKGRSEVTSILLKVRFFPAFCRPLQECVCHSTSPLPSFSWGFETRKEFLCGSSWLGFSHLHLHWAWLQLHPWTLSKLDYALFSQSPPENSSARVSYSPALCPTDGPSPWETWRRDHSLFHLSTLSPTSPNKPPASHPLGLCTVFSNPLSIQNVVC